MLLAIEMLQVRLCHRQLLFHTECAPKNKYTMFLVVIRHANVYWLHYFLKIQICFCFFIADLHYKHAAREAS